MKIKLNKNYVKLVLPYILVTTTIYSSRYLITDKLPLIRNKYQRCTNIRRKTKPRFLLWNPR